MRYPLTDKILTELQTRFTYHPPKDDQAERYADIRKNVLHLAAVICSCSPDSRERSTALTHLDHAMMMANAAIARNEP